MLLLLDSASYSAQRCAYGQLMVGSHHCLPVWSPQKSWKCPQKNKKKTPHFDTKRKAGDGPPTRE